MTSEFKLNNVTIKRPTSFSMSRYNISVADRVGDGTMVIELKSKKRKFFFKYEAINATDKKVILDILWETMDPWVTLSYVEDNVVKTAVTYVGEIPTELLRTGSKWYWSGFDFNLIEQ